jgi:hypothetical protein
VLQRFGTEKLPADPGVLPAGVAAVIEVLVVVPVFTG